VPATHCQGSDISLRENARESRVNVSPNACTQALTRTRIERGKSPQRSHPSIGRRAPRARQDAPTHLLCSTAQPCLCSRCLSSSSNAAVISLNPRSRAAASARRFTQARTKNGTLRKRCSAAGCQRTICVTRATITTHAAREHQSMRSSYVSIRPQQRSGAQHVGRSPVRAPRAQHSRHERRGRVVVGTHATSWGDHHPPPTRRWQTSRLAEQARRTS
jgi:hypothetical protein